MLQFDETALFDTLSAAQRLGFVGDRPIGSAIEHSRTVVRALADVQGRVVDLGAGGGLPGFVVAHDRPDLALTLIDRRAKRTDFLERMVRRHGLAPAVSVVAADVDDVIAACRRGEVASFDAAIARGFGPPDRTIRAMAALVRAGGRLVVTEPPTGDRWPSDLLRELGLRRLDEGGSVAVFETGDDVA